MAKRPTRIQQIEAAPEIGELRRRVNTIIFGADTFGGKLFDLLLIIAIVVSVGLVMLESVGGVRSQFGRPLFIAEWCLTVLFAIEYGLRLWCVRHPWRYALSFYGIVDLLSVLPSFLALIYPPATAMLVVRVIRILRVFRILKLVRYVGEAEALIHALAASRRKILVFLYALITLVTVFGTTMYLVEGPDNGFTSIPKGIYWAVVTLTTVGYGDISPHTSIGQFIAALVMICGYATLAVPTGIYAAELAQEISRVRDARGCHGCGQSGHERDADYCKHCGHKLDEPTID